MTTLKVGIEYNDYDKHEEYKQLCMYIYHNGTKLPEGYEVIKIMSNPQNGFYAEAFQKDNEIIIVSRGTDISHINDLRNDVSIFRGHIPSQYYSLMKSYSEIARMVADSPNIKIKFVGYSLSGTLSRLASQTTGYDAVIFAPIVGNFVLPEYMLKSSKIINYFSEDDWLVMSNLKYQRGEMRIIEYQKGTFPHFLQNFKSLEDYIIYTKLEYDEYPQNPQNYIKQKRKYVKKQREQRKNLSDIRNGIDAVPDSCAGSYPVSGYIRTCGAKHSKIPKLNNLPKEEIDELIRKYI